MKSSVIADRINISVTFISVLIAIIIGLHDKSVSDIFKAGNFNSLTGILLIAGICITFLVTKSYYEIKLEKLKAASETEKSSLNEFFTREQEALRKTKLQLSNCRRLIYDIDIERYTDVITGIPNQIMCETDIERTTRLIKEGELYQIMLIDIDSFSMINEKYGYTKGDELIRAIAENLYYSIRRNENVYKKKFIPNDEPLMEQVYRKYRGGDEFIIIIKGTQDDAVGFLTRIHRQLKDFSKKTIEILPAEFDINFHAAIAPLYGGDSWRSAMERVEECFVVAKRLENPLRVKWFRDVQGQLDRPIYQKAIEEFRK